MCAWPFQNPSKTKSCLRTIVIATEGTVTEPEYFSQLNSMKKSANFIIVPNYGNGSDPTKVLERMKKYLQENALDESDEAWIVIDQDKWTKEQMAEVEAWFSENLIQHHIAVSKKKFEHWLKLHTKGDKKSEKKYNHLLTGRDKHIPDGFITKKRVLDAIQKAKNLAPTAKSVGNVYELIEKFFS